ncbi:MAG: hypothetical protein ISS36_01565 [Candidatus Aenigmarchaeota archaeon]|nr:hypothetical protein [Candidatus Aenigmarchaeota archaeon]
MAVIKIIDECLAPDKFIHFDYSGPDPWGVAKKISESARGFFHLGASAFYFDRINWDISGDPVSFWGLWKCEIPTSRWSTIWIYIRVQGDKGKTNNVGKFTMRMNAEIITQFEGWKLFLRPLYNLYSYLFYNKVKRRLLERCTGFVLGFRNEIKEHFNVQTTEIPSAQAEYG